MANDAFRRTGSEPKTFSRVSVLLADLVFSVTLQALFLMQVN